MQPNHQGQVLSRRAERALVRGAEGACIQRARKASGLWRIWLLVASILAAGVINGALLIATGQEAQAQEPRSLRIPRTVLEDRESDAALEEPEAESTAQPRIAQKIIIDTDPGVDDAAALIWLLSQQLYPIEPLAIVTVAGNTSVENATRNAQFVLSLVGREDIPVVPGAAAPLEVDLSSSVKLIHGPDGLWLIPTFAGLPDIGPLSDEAAGYYCEALAADAENILVITLGPLTNLANAIQSDCAVAWEQVHIVSLGGAFAGGNHTPVAEYNIWQDPEAASIVLGSGAQVTLVLADALSQFTLGQGDLTRLANTGASPIQMLLPAVQLYLQVVGGVGVGALPDPAVAMVALDPSLASSRPAIVRVVESSGAPEYVRGQTVMAFDFPERVPLLLDDSSISDIIDSAMTALEGVTPEAFPDVLNQVFGQVFGEFAMAAHQAAVPNNASVVTDIDANKMRNRFLQGLATEPLSVNATQDETSYDVSGMAGDQEMEDGQQEHHLYLPSLPGK